MIVALAVLFPVGVLLILAVALDDRAAAGAITLTVGTNASAVLETEHDIQGFLLPLCLVALAGAGLRTLARPVRFAGRTDLGIIGWGALGAIVLSALLGPFVAATPRVSAEAVSQLAKHLLVAAALIVVARSAPALRAALWGLVAAGGLLAAVTVVQWVTGTEASTVAGFGSWNSELLGGVGDATRAAGPFGEDPNAYAQYLVVMVGAALGLLISRTVATMSSWQRWVTVTAVALMVVGIVATSSRTGLVGLFVVGGAAMFVARPSARHVALAAVGAAVLLVGPLDVSDRLATLDDVARAPDPSSVGVDAGLRGRTSEMLAAADMFTDHPWLGVGYGAYNSRYLDYSRQIGLDDRVEERSAHSLPLEIAAEQGIVGIAAWGTLAVVATLVAARLRRRLPAVGVGLSLALLGFAATSLFLHDVHPRLMWSLIGLTLAAPAAIRAAGIPPAPDRERPVVAMVIQNYVPALGGAERQLANLVPLLRERGLDPVVITRACAGRPVVDDIDGVTVIRIPVFGPKVVRSLVFVVRARWELWQLRPDVVHAFDTLTPSTIAIGHRAAVGTPALTKILRSGELGDLQRLERKRGGRTRLRRLVDRIDVFVAISSDIVDELRERGVPADRRVRIPNGVDTDRFRPPVDGEERPNGMPSGPVVIATGRLAGEKRLAEIAWRWPVVTARIPGAQLVLVGDGEERRRLESRDGVVLLGRRDDVPELVRSADVYVSASSAEGLSNSLLEAMASGVACVVTDVGGVRDVITDDELGVVVPADDLNALIIEVAQLLRDPERRADIGAAARHRVATAYSLTVTADRLAGLYHEVARAGVRARLDARTRAQSAAGMNGAAPGTLAAGAPA